MCILAIDLGKSKSVVCIYESQNGKYKFVGIKTNPEEIHDLILKYTPDRVVIEICSLAGWIGDLVRGMGVDLQVANPNHEAWRWRRVKRKTDRDDALKLAKLSAMNQLPLVYLPEYKVRQWRSLIQYRQSLVRRGISTKNRIRAILDSQGLAILPPGKKGWTNKSLKILQVYAQTLEKTDIYRLWQGMLAEELLHLKRIMESLAGVEFKLDQLATANERVKLLRTIPGIGPRAAEMIVAVIDDPRRFKNGKHVGSYLGLTPRLFESCTISRQGRITGQGHKYLRAILVEVAWTALRHNAWARACYRRIRAGSKARTKIAIIAVARKLLICCWAMLRDGKPWRMAKVAKVLSAVV